jgi:AcrR family transcriptional regulator
VGFAEDANGSTSSRRTGPGPNTMKSDRKSTQRKRLIDGMIDAVGLLGYGAASIAHVIERAGVSRPTFYEYFDDKDDCFQAALTEINGRLLGEMRQSVSRQSGEHAVDAALQALLRFADTQPGAARALFRESMAGGRAALDVRDRGLAQAHAMIEEAFDELPKDTLTPDTASRAMLGGVYRLLARRLRHAANNSQALLDDLMLWASSYERPRGQHRWRSLRPLTLPSAVIHNPPPRFPAQDSPPASGRTWGAVSASERLRILHAVAYIAEERGYAATTVAQITEIARVDSGAFYRHFEDKQRAFAAVNELYFQQLMAVTASAFIGGRSWPQRIWDAALASARFLEQNRNLAYVGFVEALAGGDESVKRVEDSLLAFTLFLQEGYQYAGLNVGGPEPSRVTLEAIALTSWEITYSEIRGAGSARLAGLTGHVSWLSLAPFLGVDEANRSIDERFAEARARR